MDRRHIWHNDCSLTLPNMTTYRWIRAFVAPLLAIAIVAGGSAAAQGTDNSSPLFRVGDRIAITYEPPTSTTAQPGPMAGYFSDTLTVRDGLIIRLPIAGMGDISLEGVRRGNIQRYLTQQFGKYVRDPVVHATPLVRVSVVGEVGRPGFYFMPSDILLSDAIMKAGGPTGNADPNRSVIKRDGREVLDSRDAAAAITSGKTLDEIGVEPGDEVVVGEKSRLGFGTALQVASVLIPLAGLLLALARR